MPVAGAIKRNGVIFKTIRNTQVGPDSAGHLIEPDDVVEVLQFLVILRRAACVR